MIDGIGVLVLDLAVELVVAPLGSLAVGRVFGLGHLLSGFFELVLESISEARPDLATSIKVSPGSKSISWRSRLTRIPGRTNSQP